MSQAVNLTPDQAQQITYNYLRTNYALPDPISKLITAQSGHETDGWTSNVWYTYNNGFGYGYQGNGVYNYYDNVEDTIDAVVTWLDRHAPGYETFTDPDQYATALKNAGYYTDQESNYANGITRWLNDNLQLAAGGSVAILVGIALLIWAASKKH